MSDHTHGTAPGLVFWSGGLTFWRTPHTDLASERQNSDEETRNRLVYDTVFTYSDPLYDLLIWYVAGTFTPALETVFFKCWLYWTSRHYCWKPYTIRQIVKPPLTELWKYSIIYIVTRQIEIFCFYKCTGCYAQLVIHIRIYASFRFNKEHC
jgi:hypothetical protein